MAYIINRYDGSRLVVVDDGILDSSIPVGLVGRNYTGWGEVFNENFVFLLENFKGSNPPVRALDGQAWYDSSNQVLKVYDGEQWNPIGNAAVSATEPNSTQGGLWLKSTTDQLHVSVGNEWKLVGPEGIDGFDITRVKSELIEDAQGVSRPVAVTYINGQPISIFSAETFSIPVNAVPGFSSIERGLTFRSDSVIAGSLKGNADTASVFSTPRNINGVGFDGSQNITIKSTTTNPLLKGDYIVGSDWDGSLTDTWSVDASPENRIGKVVARDANGEFSAERITSNLTGNVAGNVTALSGTSQFNNINAVRITAPEFIGNASTATRLRTARTINTVQFDGTNNIILPVPAETLVGTTLAPAVISSSITSLGKLTSLAVEDPGIEISNAESKLKILVDQFTPTIRSEQTNAIKLELFTGSSLSTASDITFISASSSAQSSIAGPALVPDFNKTVINGQKINLGLPTSRWNTVYSNNIDGTNLKISTVTAAENLIEFNNGIRVAGTITGNLFGNVTGNITGTVTGNLVGAASLNVLKSGDTMTGDLSWNQSDRGITWSAFTDGASIKFYSSGDTDQDTRLEFNTFDNGNEYFLFTHTFEAGNKINLLRLDPNDNFGNVRMSVFGNVIASGQVSANSFAGTGTDLTNINAANLSTGRVPNQRLTGSYNIGITGNAATVSSITSGQVTGALGYTPSNIAGSNLTGDWNWSSTGRGLNWSMNTDGASIIFYNTGDSDTNSRLEFNTRDNGNEYFRWTHTGTGAQGTFESMRLVPNSSTNAALTVSGSINATRDISAARFIGSGALLSSVNASNLAAGTVPTGRLAGTYNISISGNAATASSAATATNVSGGSVNATSGAFNGVLNVSAGVNGGIRFPDNAFGGSGDTARITLETKGGEATTLTFRVTNDANDTIGFFAPNNNGLTMNNNIVFHAANYTTFVPTRTGVGASGTWPISITGNANTVSAISNAQVIAALGFTPAPAPIAAGGDAQFRSLLIDSVGNAEIRFNSRGDANVDLAISVQGENFVIYEPDDGNREWFRINDVNTPAGNGVDNQAAFVYGQKIYSHSNLRFTSATQQFAVGFTNIVGRFNDNSNFFDVFPPAGYTMNNLLAFIPSIAIIHYAGGVDGNDSLRCIWRNLGNRIRVFVQNTEQRSTPAANWLAIWRR